MTPLHQKIAQRRALGYPNAMIAEEFGMTISGVMKCVQKYSLPRRQQENNIPEEPLRKLVADGCGVAEIAAKLNKKQRSITEAMKRLHIFPKADQQTKVAYRRRTGVLQPPIWEELDDALFKTVATAFADTGSGYAAINSFAEKHSLRIDAVQARWHRISIYVGGGNDSDI